jgi:hypothetical protein
MGPDEDDFGTLVGRVWAPTVTAADDSARWTAELLACGTEKWVVLVAAR